MYTEAFARAGGKKEQSEKIDLLEAIYRQRKDLRGKPVVFPQQGQKGYVVIIGNEVFKGPRKPHGEWLDDFQTEEKTLKELEGRGLAMPKITTTGEGYMFFGMSLAPGELMGGDFEEKMSPKEQRQLAKDLINFVVEMAHALPQKDGKFAVHDDLWYNNIFIDSKTKRLSGVIDFGKVKYIRPDEWKPMFDFDGTKFHDMLVEEYNNRKSELLLEGKQDNNKAAKPVLSKIRAILGG